MSAAEQVQPFDLERMLHAADTLTTEIMAHDQAVPGFALLLTRALIARMPPEDALALVKWSPPIDPAALIG